MVKLLRHAVDLGCTFFDTAVVDGEANEELLGEAFSSVRDQVVQATKFGIAGQRIEDGKTVNLLDSKPASIRVQAEGSLRRLRTDHIDLYYQHRVDPHVDPSQNIHRTQKVPEEKPPVETSFGSTRCHLPKACSSVRRNMNIKYLFVLYTKKMCFPLNIFFIKKKCAR